jgi:Family of unknown function (DUF6498)
MTNQTQSKPKKKKKYLLIVANIFPLFAVIFLNWSVFELVFVYFSETVLFFFLNLVKIFFLKIPVGSKIGNFILYLFVFSIFIAFAGAILFLYYFAELEKIYPDYSVEEIVGLMFKPSYFISLAVFVGVDIYYFIKHFLGKKEYLKHTAQTLIRQPGLRIWILLMITFASVAVIKANQATSIIVLAIFILLKTWIDLIVFKEKKDNVDVRELYEK